MAEPHRVVASVERYRGNRIRVREDTVAIAGIEGVHSREIVETPDAVVIVPVDAEGNVLMVEQYRNAAGRVLLELPAGGLEPGETPLACAQRELREEAGHSAASWTRLGAFYTVPGIASELMHAFLAADLTEDPLPADVDEDVEMRRVAWGEALRMARGGELMDGKSIAALLLAEPLVRQRAG